MKTATARRADFGLQTLRIIFLRHKNWLKSEMRVRLNQGKVEQYAREKKQNAKFPPPVAFFDNDELYWVGDGFHRIEADYLNGETETEVDVHRGSFQEAVLWNLKSNRESQGLPFAQGDFTKAIKFMLTHNPFKGWDRTRIATAIGCTVGMVSKVAIRDLGMRKNPRMGRKPDLTTANRIHKMLQNGQTPSEVAKTLGMSERTVYRREILSHYTTCPTCNGTGRILKETNP